MSSALGPTPEWAARYADPALPKGGEFWAVQDYIRRSVEKRRGAKRRQGIGLFISFLFILALAGAGYYVHHTAQREDERSAEAMWHRLILDPGKPDDAAIKGLFAVARENRNVRHRVLLHALRNGEFGRRLVKGQIFILDAVAGIDTELRDDLAAQLAPYSSVESGTQPYALAAIRHYLELNPRPEDLVTLMAQTGDPRPLKDLLAAFSELAAARGDAFSARNLASAVVRSMGETNNADSRRTLGSALGLIAEALPEDQVKLAAAELREALSPAANPVDSEGPIELPEPKALPRATIRLVSAVASPDLARPLRAATAKLDAADARQTAEAIVHWAKTGRGVISSDGLSAVYSALWERMDDSRRRDSAAAALAELRALPGRRLNPLAAAIAATAAPGLRDNEQQELVSLLMAAKIDFSSARMWRRAFAQTALALNDRALEHAFTSAIRSLAGPGAGQAAAVMILEQVAARLTPQQAGIAVKAIVEWSIREPSAAEARPGARSNLRPVLDAIERLGARLSREQVVMLRDDLYGRPVADGRTMYAVAGVFSLIAKNPEVSPPEELTIQVLRWLAPISDPESIQALGQPLRLVGAGVKSDQAARLADLMLARLVNEDDYDKVAEIAGVFAVMGHRLDRDLAGKAIAELIRLGDGREEVCAALAVLARTSEPQHRRMALDYLLQFVGLPDEQLASLKALAPLAIYMTSADLKSLTRATLSQMWDIARVDGAGAAFAEIVGRLPGPSAAEIERDVLETVRSEPDNIQKLWMIRVASHLPGKLSLGPQQMRAWIEFVKYPMANREPIVAAIQRFSPDAPRHGNWAAISWASKRFGADTRAPIPGGGE